MMSVSLFLLGAGPLLRRQKLSSPRLATSGSQVRAAGVRSFPGARHSEPKGTAQPEAGGGCGGCPSAPWSGQATIYVPAQGDSVSFFSQALFSTPDRGH